MLFASSDVSQVSVQGIDLRMKEIWVCGVRKKRDQQCGAPHLCFRLH